ncbi:MAG: hypothetical protein ACO2ZP_12785 [Bacteriovoracaceae bacterium]
MIGAETFNGSTKIVGHLDNGGAEQYLCSKKGWKFTFAHHFIYSARDDGKKRTVTTNIMKKSFLPLMRKCGVQIHFSGHDHDLQHIEVPKGRGFDFGIKRVWLRLCKSDS